MPGTLCGQRCGDPAGTSVLRVTNLRARRLLAEPGAVLLAWDSALAAAHGVWHKVFRNGVQVAVTRATSIVLSGLPGESLVFEVIDVGPKSGDPDYDISWAAAAVTGNKAQISWDRVADAARYAVYWDAGMGEVEFETPIALLPDTGEDRQSYLTAELPNGDYKFVVRARDAAGNESANTSALDVTIAAPPKPVSGVSLRFTPEAGGCYLLDWTDPPGLEDPGCVRIYQGALALPDEWDPNLGSWPEPDYETPIVAVGPGVQEFSPSLAPNTAYVFAFRVYDGEAVEEANTDVRIRFEAGPMDETESWPLDYTARPAPAEGVAATPIAGGKIRVTGLIPFRPGSAAPTGAKVWYGETAEAVLAGDGTEAAVELSYAPDGWAFAWDSPAFAESVTRFFLVRGGAGDAEDDPGGPPYAPFSAADVVSAVADATAPDAPGDQAAAAAAGGEG